MTKKSDLFVSSTEYRLRLSHFLNFYILDLRGMSAFVQVGNQKFPNQIGICMFLFLQLELNTRQLNM